MVLLVHLVLTELRARLDLVAQMELLELVVHLVTVVRVVLLVLLDLLGLLGQMVSPEPKERWESLDRRESLVPLDLRDHLELLDLWDPLVFLDLKALVVLRALLEPLVSLELQAEWALLDLMATLDPLARPVPLVKMDQRAPEVTPEPQDDREMLVCVEHLDLRERRERLERMDPLVLTDLQGLRV